jgi:hypothetical protein
VATLAGLAGFAGKYTLFFYTTGSNGWKTGLPHFWKTWKTCQKRCFLKKSWKVMESHGKVLENHGWSWKSDGNFFSMQNNFVGKS